MVKISMTNLAALVEEHSFYKTGDRIEMTSGSLITTRFGNAERFWRYFVVPFTVRIMQDPKLVELAPTLIGMREGVAGRILDINEIHYSIFLHLVACHKLLASVAFLAFTDFYVHLSTVHELAIKFARDILNYFEDCVDGGSRGSKQRKDIVKQFYCSSTIYEEFTEFGAQIDHYRNRIVHHPMIGLIFTDRAEVLIPRKEYIERLDSWQKVFRAGAAIDQNRDKFVELISEMNADLNQLEDMLDRLWWPVVERLKTLLFVQNNPRLLHDFVLENTD
jgi:hypothetical protein